MGLSRASPPGFTSSWVHYWVHRLSLWFLFLVIRSLVFSVLFSRLGLLFLWLSWIFFFRGRRVVVDFFSKGEEEEEEIEVCWVSFVEIECLILEFHSEF